MASGAPVPERKDGSMPKNGMLALLALAALCMPARGEIFSGPEYDWRFGRFSVTPFAGYRFGGEMEPVGGGGTYDVEASNSYGVLLGWSLTDPVYEYQGGVELIWSHQPTEVRLGAGTALELNIDYFHIGGAYVWDYGRFSPFVGGSAGVTLIDPQESGSSSETGFSMAIGAGGKIRIADHVGLRLEARGYGTFLESADTIFVSSRGGAVSFSGSTQVQGDLTAGLVITF
jgi:hypothetical protein